MKLVNEMAALLRVMMDSHVIAESSELFDQTALALKLWEESRATEEQIAAAREVADKFGDGYDVEIDDDAQVSVGDSGHFISAWVFVRTPEEDSNDAD
jgi:hypothetical protein